MPNFAIGTWCAAANVLTARRKAVRIFSITAGSKVAGADSTTLVEAVSDGWWSLFLPAGRLVEAFMTDTDLLNSAGAHRPEGLADLLDEALATRSRGAAADADLTWSQAQIRPAPHRPTVRRPRAPTGSR